MDFTELLSKVFNPGGPMDLSTGKTAAPTGMDVTKGIGQGLGKGFGIANIIADAIGGVPTYQAPAPKNDLEELLKRLGPQRQTASPLEDMLSKLFGMKPTNSAMPAMKPMSTQIPTGASQIGRGTGGLY